MGRLRNGTADLLLATDVAARGLDVDTLTHVVNYDVPSAPEAYVHRIGRVGRAGREGTAITLAGPREHRLLKNIERVTGQHIDIRKVPTVADLRSRRLELTMSNISEMLDGDDLDQYRVVIDALSDDHDIVEIALAAVKMAHEATGAAAEDDVEIPDVSVRRDRDDRKGPRRDDRGDRGGDRGGDRPERGKGRQRRGPSPGMAKVFISAGREAGIRPQDLVGAIANETRLEGRQIGAIDIAPRFSLVEVPEEAVDEVTWALKRTTLKGRKVTVRRDRGQS